MGWPWAAALFTTKRCLTGRVRAAFLRSASGEERDATQAVEPRVVLLSVQAQHASRGAVPDAIQDEVQEQGEIPSWVPDVFQAVPEQGAVPDAILPWAEHEIPSWVEPRSSGQDELQRSAQVGTLSWVQHATHFGADFQGDFAEYYERQVFPPRGLCRRQVEYASGRPKAWQPQPSQAVHGWR